MSIPLATGKCMSHNYDHLPYYPTQIDIPIELQPLVMEMLSQTLESIIELQILIKQSQWNEEMQFYQPHDLLDEIVAVLGDYINLFTNWITALSDVGRQTNRTAAIASVLPKDLHLNILIVKDYVTALMARLTTYAQLLGERNKQTAELDSFFSSELFVQKTLWLAK